ncbi:MAG: DUF5118 domain-containing protein, partial [Bacteroidota bacterium]
MRKHAFVGLLLVFLLGNLIAQPSNKAPKTITEFTQNFTTYPGYFDFYWDAQSGKIYLRIDNMDEEFLYVNGLTGGLGSNDIGLDRNQLGSDRIVKFTRSGP